MSEFKSSAAKIELIGYEELFGSGQSVKDEADVKLISIDEIRDFKGHPFKVVDDEKMDELINSIKEFGILTPGVVRELPDGSYEMISGHRRKHALERLNMEEMPVIIREYGDDEAAIAMVDANIQREDVLPSEKAWAYKMKYDAMKHQGSKECGNSLNVIGENAGESGKTVQRYIWLTRLNIRLLQLVDEKKIGFSQGVDLSFLSSKEQKWVGEVLEKQHVKITTKKSALLKECSKSGQLTKEKLRDILVEQKPNNSKWIINGNRISQYFPSYYTAADIEKVVFALLEKWVKEQEEA